MLFSKYNRNSQYYKAEMILKSHRKALVFILKHLCMHTFVHNLLWIDWEIISEEDKKSNNFSLS